MLATVGKQVQVMDDLEIKRCPACGVIYGAPVQLMKVKRDKNQSWWCPNGHELIPKCNEAERLRGELERKERILQKEREYSLKVVKDRDAARRCAAAQKGQKTRIKNRIARGVCPCCNRSFADLGAHMQQKHPHFTEQD